MKTFVIALATLLALQPAQAAEKKPVPACLRADVKPGKHSDKSIYQLGSTWTSDLGNDLKLTVSKGRPVVIAMVFTNCQHSCPTIVADMKAIEAALPKSAKAQTDFVLLSIDPARDTVEVLQAFRDKHKLGKEHWMLLRGPAKDVASTAEFLGFKYSSGSETQYAHSLLVTVLNKNGEVVFQQAGLGTDPRPAAKAIAAELKKE